MDIAEGDGEGELPVVAAIETTAMEEAAMDTIASSVETITSSVDTIAGNVETISPTVETITTTVDSIPDTVDPMDTTVDGISTSVETVSTTVEGISADVETMVTPVESISTTVETIANSIETLSGNIVTIPPNVVAIPPSLVTISSNLVTLPPTVVTIAPPTTPAAALLAAQPPQRVPLRVRCEFGDIFRYLTNAGYPSHVVSKGQKANFRRSASAFCVQEGKLYYKKKLKDATKNLLLVIWTKEDVDVILKEFHEGTRDPDGKAAPIGSRAHHGISATASMVSSRFYWRSMQSDIQKFVKSCPQCQGTSTARATSAAVNAAVKAAALPVTVMQKFGVDIISMPESDGFRFLIVAIDHFTKWSEAEAIQDRSASSVALFLRRLFCRHGAVSIQINDQGREFVSSVASELLQLTGVSPEITCAFHPEANGVIEKQNWVIKEKFTKILETRPEDWPRALDSVLYGHRTASHSSTGYSPFYMLYGRQPNRLVDVEYEQKTSAPGTEDWEFDSQYVECVMIKMVAVC